MIVAVIDNGSLEPAATINLRTVAARLAAQAGVCVHAVSWKHSDRVSADKLDGEPATTLDPWMEAQLAAGQREFLFVPFFVSAQGAIGSALRGNLEKLQTPATPFAFAFTASLASSGVISEIVAARVRETAEMGFQVRPPVIVVDHGGPSAASAELRNQIAADVRKILGEEIGPLVAASMEGEDHAHNRPLLAEQLRAPGFSSGEVIVALLFLSPGRHAGPGGDVARICAAAEIENPALQCNLTDLVGTHPLAVDALSDALQAALSTNLFPASHEPSS